MSSIFNRCKSAIYRPCVLCCSPLPQRFVVYGLTSAALFVCFFQRHTFYQAIADIFVNNIELDALDSVCPRMISYYQRNRTISSKNYLPWKPAQITGVNQAFFIGFLVILIPGGVMADKYGGKSTMAVGIAIATLVTTVQPTLAEFGPSILACGRLLQGLGQGLVYPAVSAITAQWAPISERTAATGIIYGAQFFGWAAGYWAHLQYDKYSLEWNVQFYVCAVLGSAWLILWILFASSKPSHCSYIKRTELDKINSLSNNEYDRMVSAMPLFVPWKEILLSFPLLALILINWAGLWIHYTFLNQFKFYLMDVIGLTREVSNDAAEISHTALGLSTVTSGFVSDWLINRDYMSRTVNRKVFAFLSNVLPIPIMMSVLLAGCQGQIVASLYLTINFFRGPFYAALRTNLIDLNPHFAGVNNGIFHCTGAIVALFSWDFFSAIVENTSSTTEWGSLFLALSGIMLFLSLPYLLFGSGNLQPWGISKLRPPHISPIPSSMSTQR